VQNSVAICFFSPACRLKRSFSPIGLALHTAFHLLLSGPLADLKFFSCFFVCCERDFGQDGTSCPSSFSSSIYGQISIRKVCFSHRVPTSRSVACPRATRSPMGPSLTFPSSLGIFPQVTDHRLFLIVFFVFYPLRVHDGREDHFLYAPLTFRSALPGSSDSGAFFLTEVLFQWWTPFHLPFPLSSFIQRWRRHVLPYSFNFFVLKFASRHLGAAEFPSSLFPPLPYPSGTRDLQPPSPSLHVVNFSPLILLFVLPFRQ